MSQGALTASERLTPLGGMLSRLPVDVTVGKMLVLGSALRQMGPTLSAAAALSVQSPLTNRAFRDPDCLVSDPPQSALLPAFSALRLRLFKSMEVILPEVDLCAYNSVKESGLDTTVSSFFLIKNI